MSKSDPLRHVLLAAVLLTRLPLPRLPAEAFADGARAVWAYPLVGVLVGGVGAGVGELTLSLGAGISAVATLAAMIVLTGAMHEDGLADLCDGFWGATAPARRLEIMRDSQIGTYGVLGLGLVTALRGLAIAALGGGLAVVAAAALSRGAMPALMATLPHARADGLAHSVGRPSRRTATVAFAIGGAVAIPCAGWTGMVALVVVAGVTLGLGALARHKIGGQTGDVLGAAQQLGEAAALLSLLALAA
ncbi:adenosylcobinamide-GDP ribazoletransferase [Sulfitobacter albidus]|uniref:Adenosylcobinamide-GDP ribazoletransferase n=1 Tax=Sulfitobacter albidus TaxID=2829501 RepID=A0A975JB28_9RHOB|nr:adenosylcobinamide-GDP ribazoletransferase [Sulfitobacter albidus]QUJ75158.1 adenosylcobinamide-GDP ribazoletransferase [Sulfitobacter albidus]